MSTALLDNRSVDAYLARLGAPEVRHDSAGLATLQAAHLRAIPFHNLRLLANDGQPYLLPALDQVVEDAIAGIGGNCDHTTPPFTALLQSMGFDAQLIAASVQAPGDHFACLVHMNGRRLLCDVGNGHPYLHPWDLDGAQQTQTFSGWRFVFDPYGSNGPTLFRALDGGGLKTVYVVDPTPRSYADFAPMVRAHYGHAGFGPFLTGLRAVDIRDDAVWTLRDGNYTRHTHMGRSVRHLQGRDAIEALLKDRFGLPGVLVDQALSVLARRRPDLLRDEPRWLSLGRGTLAASAKIEPPARDLVPDVLISLATIGRADSVRRLLRSIAADRDASGYPGRVGVLLVENHAGPPIELPAVNGLTTHQVPIQALASGLERAAQTGVVPAVEHAPVPIGMAREAQLHALHAHFKTPVDGLPHPDAHPTVVWMLDDDIAFEQLGEDGQIERRTNLLFRAARLWATLPQHSVVLGTYTGDPPVPGLDCMGGQVRDLTISAERLVRFGPNAKWAPPLRPGKIFDAYYDLTESAAPPGDAAWPYAPERAGAPGRVIALALLRDLTRLLDGQQVTRRLVWDGEDRPPRSSLRRGGNTLFLDLDTLFRWPTPVLRSSDRITTRRADSLWAALARRDDPSAVVEATLPVLHLREGQSVGTGAQANLASHSAAQIRGVVMTRAVDQGRCIATTLATREARVTDHRANLRRRLADLRRATEAFAQWNDADVDVALESALTTLRELDMRAANGAPVPGNATEIEAFVHALPEAEKAWREMW